MLVTTIEFIDVSEKIASLGANPVSRLTLLPANFESASSIEELKQNSESATVRTLFRHNSIALDELTSQEIPYIQNNSFEWVGPTIFVTAAMLSSDPSMVAIALNVISNYATDFFKGLTDNGRVKLDIVVERRNSKISKRISYEGPPEGLKTLPSIIEAASNE